ncbi:pancreatic triacylglycerol lipase-like [Brevipalpus obovatus]|uniref:pancreatic triacylglycerol lipase-like n=1 Tax=Brevipalpus obovatus TaxID=246614 RepID=UPI003D9E2186
MIVSVLLIIFGCLVVPSYGGNLFGDVGLLDQLPGFMDIILARPSSSTRCFENLGCFSRHDFPDPLGNSIIFLPKSPEEMDLKYMLYTNKNRYESKNLRYNFTAQELSESGFDASKKTKFIVHGWMSNFDEMDWMGNLKDLTLRHKADQYNIFGVDWSKGAKTINYFKSVANVRVVAAATTFFLKRLQEYAGIKYQDVHLIGHSLGGHIVGFVGKNLTGPQIGRITALDPAGPSFYKDGNTRLTSTDAKYVEAIHTDGGRSVLRGYGITDTVGDIDYYPNGGRHQPECGYLRTPHDIASKGLVKGVENVVTCDHNFATRLINQDPDTLIESCQFIGYECDKWENFQKGYCIDCGQSEEKCAAISIWGEEDDKLGGVYYRQSSQQEGGGALKNRKFFYKTDGEKDYCLHHYGIVLHTSAQSGSATGMFKLSLNGRRREVDEIKLRDSSEKFDNSKSYPFLYTNKRTFGQVRNATLQWSTGILGKLNPFQFFTNSKVSVDRIEIRYMSNINAERRQKESTILCANSQMTGEGQTFVRCQ